MDLPSLLPLIGGLLAAGVAVYLARSNRDSIIASTTKNAVEALGLVLDRQDVALERQKAEIAGLNESLSVARERIAVLERQHSDERDRTKQQSDVIHECRRRIARLSAAVERLGGHVDDNGDIEDDGDHEDSHVSP